MRAHTARWARVAATALVALGLVATTCVDVAVASERRAKQRKAAAVRAEQRAERSLLRDLSAIATDVMLAADPVQTSLRAASLPEPGQLVGARDAIAHGGAADALATAVTRLRGLHAPAPMRSGLAKLTKDVDDLHTLAARLAAYVDVKDLLVLSKRLNDDDADTFGVTSATVLDDLSTLYDRQHLTPPSVDSRAEDATSASWIFGASSACIDAQVALIPVFAIKSIDGVATAERLSRLWQHALSLAATRIGRLPRPTGRQALPPGLTSRLGVMRYNASLFSAQVSALKRSDLTTYQLNAAKIRTVLPSLAQLSKAFRGYGAVGCANVLDGWAGVSHARASTGGVRSA